MILTKISDQHAFPVPVGYCIDWIHHKNENESINTIALQCPTCTKAFCLANHTIDSCGAVLPSVVCPFNCGFHTMIRIEIASSI